MSDNVSAHYVAETHMENHLKADGKPSVGILYGRNWPSYQTNDRFPLFHLKIRADLTQFTTHERENDAASQAASERRTKRYASGNDLFPLFSPWIATREKMQYGRGKVMGQDGFTAISHQSASRELSGASLENICGGKNEKNQVKQQLCISFCRVKFHV
jgi:hypothetical protein